jgi:hypothetical protein
LDDEAREHDREQAGAGEVGQTNEASGQTREPRGKAPRAT